MSRLRVYPEPPSGAVDHVGLCFRLACVRGFTPSVVVLGHDRGTLSGTYRGYVGFRDQVLGFPTIRDTFFGGPHNKD